MIFKGKCMFLDNYEEMDPVMLMSIINMKLRNEFNGELDDLVKTYSLDKKRLEQKLADADFIFNTELGQFR